MDSGLKLYYPANSAFARALAIDPRDEIQQIMEDNADDFPWFGGPPTWVVDRCVTISKMYISNAKTNISI